MRTYCGLDCENCSFHGKCMGCKESCGSPFGHGGCPLARCSIQKGHDCSLCAACALKQALMDEFNALHIPGMPEITQLFALKGSVVNLPYPLPSGSLAKFWDDEAIYLGAQVEKTGSNRCFGLAAGDDYLMVSEYGENGSDPQIVVFKRRK